MRDDEGHPYPGATAPLPEDSRAIAERDEKSAKEKRILDRIEENRRNMTPENRALFDRIRAIRDRIGRVPFNVVDLVREVRDDE